MKTWRRHDGSNNEVRDDLLARIREKRHQVEVFVCGALPRKRRLLNVTIFAGTLAAAFTAGPAAGGASFTAWLTSTLGWNQQILAAAAIECE